MEEACQVRVVEVVVRCQYPGGEGAVAEGACREHREVVAAAEALAFQAWEEEVEEVVVVHQVLRAVEEEEVGTG